MQQDCHCGPDLTLYHCGPIERYHGYTWGVPVDPYLATPPSHLQLTDDTPLTFLRRDTIASTKTPFVGIVQPGWNERHSQPRRWPRCLPLQDLDCLPLVPSVVWCAARSLSVWPNSFDHSFHPGLLPLLKQVAKLAGCKQLYRSGPWEYEFICATTVATDLARFFQQTYKHVQEHYGVNGFWPIIGEALVMLYFAQRVDLTILQIPTDCDGQGRHYYVSDVFASDDPTRGFRQCGYGAYSTRQLNDDALRYLAEHPEHCGAISPEWEPDA